MYVSQFYEPCSDQAFFRSLQAKTGKYVFSDTLRVFLDTIEDFMVSEKKLSLIRDLLTDRLADIQFDYEWERETFVGDSVKQVENLLKWLSENYDGKISNSCTCSYAGYEQSVSLIVSKDNCPTALIISVGKNKFSPAGRSVLTKSENNLRGLVVKGALNTEFPGIGVACIYLSSDSDKAGNIGDSFTISNTRNSNVYIFDFEGVDIDERIALVTSQNVTTDCNSCRYVSLCRMKKKKPHAAEVSKEEKKPYVLPKYTASQLKVVTHKDGPLLVVAPPGSGKTATLIGRMKWLIEQGVDPAFILAISFTKAAASELSERITDVCGSALIPTCSTINALALNILTQNESIVGKVKTLTTRDNLHVIDELLSVLQVPDFSGEKYGTYGSLMTAARWLNGLKECEFDRDEFTASKKGAVSDAFFELAELYFARIKAEGYITYDEQVEMACRFLEEYPEAEADYQAIWKYVMVDEYQDVNSSQAELIYRIAGHGNIVVVGDDDQSIYGFRGAKPQVMVDFLKDFKAQKIELMENFRSTSAIFDASKDVVKINNRIEKEGRAVRQGGMAPIVKVGSSASDVAETIADALKQGFSYRDIAVLSGTNKKLEELNDVLECPTKLQKSLVVDTDIFNGIYYGMTAIIEPANKEALWRLDQMGYGKDLLDILKSESDVNNLIDRVAELLDSPEEEVSALKGQVEEERVNTLEGLYDLMAYMIHFEDDTRVDVVSNRSDEVLLITSHESKGLEFPVVILIDEKKQRVTDEERRVLYVSMTRAKDRLYILKKSA